MNEKIALHVTCAIHRFIPNGWDDNSGEYFPLACRTHSVKYWTTCRAVCLIQWRLSFRAEVITQ